MVFGIQFRVSSVEFNPEFSARRRRGGEHVLPVERSAGQGAGFDSQRRSPQPGPVSKFDEELQEPERWDGMA